MSDDDILPDNPKEWGLVLGVAVFVFFFNAQIAAVAAQPATLFNSPEPDLVFTEEQIENMNWGSERSVGLNAIADERLYCFSVDNKQVTELFLADDITVSEFTAVSGGCFETGKLSTGVDGFIHTHPNKVRQLSDEDKKGNGGVSYSCVQWAEIVEVTGTVTGIDCYKLDSQGNIDNPDKQKITVGIK